MKYKATLGTTSIVITIFISLLLCCLIALIVRAAIAAQSVPGSIVAFLIIIFLGALFTLAYLYHPKIYVLDNTNLIIRRPIKDVKISLHEIKDVFIVKKESMTWTERVGGNGGLFGFYGDFKTSFGLTTWYATRLRNYVMIETIKNDKIIITPDNTDIVKEIRNRLRNES